MAIVASPRSRPTAPRVPFAGPVARHVLTPSDASSQLGYIIFDVLSTKVRVENVREKSLHGERPAEQSLVDSRTIIGRNENSVVQVDDGVAIRTSRTGSKLDSVYDGIRERHNQFRSHEYHEIVDSECAVWDEMNCLLILILDGDTCRLPALSLERHMV